MLWIQKESLSSLAGFKGNKEGMNMPAEQGR